MPHTEGIHERTAIPLGQARWLKVVLLLALMIPPITAAGIDPSNTSDLIKTVLQRPLAYHWPVLLPIAKYALLGIALACLWQPRWTGPLGWGAYAVWLVLTGFLQNMALTERWGFAWAIGNTIPMLAVAAIAGADVLGGRTRVEEGLLRQRLWVLAPMAFAWLFPYAVNDGRFVPGLSAHALWNEAGMTYCMITPVFLGVMLLRSGVHPPTLALASWVGLLFGVVNMLMWFVLNPASWWMGVLHLPLLILSAFGVWVSKRHPRRHFKGI